MLTLARTVAKSDKCLDTLKAEGFYKRLQMKESESCNCLQSGKTVIDLLLDLSSSPYIQLVGRWMPNSIYLLAIIVGREDNPCFTSDPTQTYFSF